MPASLRSAVKTRVKNALDVLGDASCAYARHIPVERWPAWLAALNGVNTPRRIRALPLKSPLCAANINIVLALVQMTEHLAGDIAECGVFRGATLIPTAMFLKQRGISKTVWGFDSFEGFDESVALDIAMGGGAAWDKRLGGMSETSYERVRQKVERLRLTGHVRLVKGYFETTLRNCADQQFSFVHLDCDVFTAYRTCLEFFYPRVVSGGIILLDEYNDPPWPGCNKAVDEFLADKPERLTEIARDNHQKYYIQKI